VERLVALLGKLLAPLVRELARVVIEEWRRPTDVHVVGGGQALAEEVNDDVESHLP